MKKLLLTLFCLLYLFSTANCVIKVIGPDTFVQWADQYKVYLEEYSLAEFGYTPYGRSLYGSVQIADPPKACSTLKAAETNNLFGSKLFGHHPIILADRGGCHYVTKTQNAQLAGAKLLMVTDNSLDTDYSEYSMMDDGHGGEINIPTILIHKKFGEKIKEFAVNHTVSLSITFDDPPQYDTVHLEIWLSNSNNLSVLFLQDMKPWIEKIYDKLEFEPHYLFYNSTNPNDTNCICQGKYCAPDPDGDGPLTGADVVEENFRQLTLFYGYSAADWWNYVTTVDPSCMISSKPRECSEEVIAKLGITAIDFAIKQSIQRGSDKTDNKLLMNQMAAKKRSHVPTPGVVINGMVYRGNVEPVSHVFSAICEGFTNAPEPCEDHKNSTGKTPVIYKKRSVKYILVVCIVGLLVFGFFLFCCYKRYLKRQIAKELSLKANTAVSEYFAMHEAGEKDTKGLIEMKNSP